MRLTVHIGWLAWDRRPHDENPDRPGCLVHSCRLRRPGHDTRSHLPAYHRGHHDLVGLHCWYVQAQASGRLQHRRRRRFDVRKSWEIYPRNCLCSLSVDLPLNCRVDILLTIRVDWAFVAGSGMLGISIGLNAVSTHGACTAIFVAVAALAGFLLGSIQTLGRISWLAWLGLTCILTASKFLLPSRGNDHI